MKLALFEQSSDVAEVLLRDCSSYLQDVKSSGMILFRHDLNGNVSEEQQYKELPIRQDRQPLTTSPEYHRAYNLYFENQFNIKDLRSRCLFTYPVPMSYPVKEDDDGVVFPIGQGVEYVQDVSGKIKDMWEVEDFMDKNGLDPNNEELFDWIDRNSTYENVDSMTELDFEAEVMVLVPSQKFYMVNHKVAARVLEQLGIRPKRG